MPRSIETIKLNKEDQVVCNKLKNDFKSKYNRSLVPSYLVAEELDISDELLISILKKDDYSFKHVVITFKKGNKYLVNMDSFSKWLAYYTHG